MNMDPTSTTQYSEISHIEIAELQQDVKLPKLPDKDKDPLTLETLERYARQGKKYKLAEQYYENMIGNFYIPILFPLVENGESTELEFDAPSTSNILNKSLKAKPYVERNFLALAIPKYLVMCFKDKIPKGTKFLAAFIGGNTSMENISIIGLYGHTLPLGGEVTEEE